MRTEETIPPTRLNRPICTTSGVLLAPTTKYDGTTSGNRFVDSQMVRQSHLCQTYAKWGDLRYNDTIEKHSDKYRDLGCHKRAPLQSDRNSARARGRRGGCMFAGPWGGGWLFAGRWGGMDVSRPWGGGFVRGSGAPDWRTQAHLACRSETTDCGRGLSMDCKKTLYKVQGWSRTAW